MTQTQIQNSYLKPQGEIYRISETDLLFRIKEILEKQFDIVVDIGTIGIVEEADTPNELWLSIEDENEQIVLTEQQRQKISEKLGEEWDEYDLMDYCVRQIFSFGSENIELNIIYPNPPRTDIEIFRSIL